MLFLTEAIALRISQDWWTMVRIRISVLLTAAGILLAAAQILLEPCLLVTANGERIALAPAQAGFPLSVRFIHSVQKTSVEEDLRIEDGGFTLDSTRYQSFGVGLPFLAEEGRFRREGDDFVFDRMNRHFPALSLRTGVGTHLVLTLGAGGAKRVLALYERWAPGTRIDLSVRPLWRVMF